MVRRQPPLPPPAARPNRCQALAPQGAKRLTAPPGTPRGPGRARVLQRARRRFPENEVRGLFLPHTPLPKVEGGVRQKKTSDLPGGAAVAAQQRSVLRVLWSFLSLSRVTESLWQIDDSFAVAQHPQQLEVPFHEGPIVADAGLVAVRALDRSLGVLADLA